MCLDVINQTWSPMFGAGLSARTFQGVLAIICSANILEKWIARGVEI